MKMWRFWKKTRWPALLLSASCLSFSLMQNGSTAQDAVNPQQQLEAALQRHQRELETMLKQHEVQRQAISSAISVAASATPVNNQAIQQLQQQLVTLHQRQDAEKQALAARQRQETETLRGAVNPQAPANGGGATGGTNNSPAASAEITPADVAEMALDPEVVPEPVVVDRTMTPLGSVRDIVFQDEAAAIQLGKALFWDVQVGSDNKTACATCHNFGGADWRVNNQLASGGNHQLTLSDFLNNSNGRLDGVVGSQGVVQKQFAGVNPPGEDLSTAPTASELAKQFTLSGTAESSTRQVTGRNAPSVINAALYSRQFWDGRAHRFFNGENIFGSQDPAAGVWENQGGSLVKNTDFLVDYSSLASQAVGPARSGVEMSHGPDGARSFADIGKKLLDARTRPLGLQKVHSSDSVLGSLATGAAKGLNTSYAEMVRKAFRPVYWNNDSSSVDGYTQMEANFALFFGLSIQAYERTLISGESRFDEFARGDANALSFDEKEGLKLFLAEGTACNACHSGAAFSEARWDNTLASPIEDSGSDVIETGWANIGVQNQSLDAGVGRVDLPFGPISLAKLAVGASSPTMKVDAQGQWKDLPAAGGEPALVDGAFKIPTLRNVELTAPYFHTGNYGTLEDVVRFYSRGGDFPENPHLDGDVHVIPELKDKQDKIGQLAAFLRSLTDERVRYRSAPFDHPELPVPDGHVAGANGVALDNMVVLGETGAEGTRTAFPMFTDRIGASKPQVADPNTALFTLGNGTTTGGAMNGGTTTAGTTTAGTTTAGTTTAGTTTAGTTTAGGTTAGGTTAGGTTAGGTTAGGTTAGGATAGGTTAGGATAGGTAAGGATAGGATAGGGAIETVTIAGGFNGIYIYEGPITAASANSMTIMDLITLDMRDPSVANQTIAGTFGDHDGLATTPPQALTWSQLGTVLSRSGLGYSDLVNHPGLLNYVAKGEAVEINGKAVPLFNARANSIMTIEPRENVVVGKLIQTGGQATPQTTDDTFAVSGVPVTSSTAVGFHSVSLAEFGALQGQLVGAFGHYIPATAGIADSGKLHVREIQSDGIAPPAGPVISAVEGPITAIGTGFLEVMGKRIDIAPTMEIPGVTPLAGKATFTGIDIPTLADNQRGSFAFRSIVGATGAIDFLVDSAAPPTSAGEAYRVNFVELAENLLIAPMTVKQGVVTPIVAGSPRHNLLLSGDRRFRGDWRDIGGVPITLGAPVDGIGQVTDATIDLTVGTFAGYYDRTTNALWVLTGDTEYHPEGTVRISLARGRQRDGSGDLDIVGQVKPLKQANGTFNIPSTVDIDAGTFGRFTLPTNPVIGLVKLGTPAVAGAAAAADVGLFKLNVRTGTNTTGTLVPKEIFGEVPSRPEIQTQLKEVDIRDVRPPVGVAVVDAAGLAPANTVASLLTTDAQGNAVLAAGVTGSVGTRLDQQRVDLAITAPGQLFDAAFKTALAAVDPLLGLAVDGASIRATATDAAGNITNLAPGFIVLPDPVAPGGVLLEGGFRGQAALDLSGKTLNVSLVNGTQQVTVISGTFSSSLAFTNTTPGSLPAPVVPTGAVVIGRDPGAGIALETLNTQLLGAVTISNRLANGRLDIAIDNVPVAAFSNRSTVFVGGLVPTTLDIALTGVTAEFLDANGDVIAVSPYFTGAFQSPTLVTLSLTVRDAAQAALLSRATQIRLVQSNAGSLGVTELVTLSSADGATAQIVQLTATPVVAGP